MKLDDHYSVIYGLCILYTIWLCWAISKNRHSLLTKINRIPHEDGVAISFGLMMITVCFMIYGLYTQKHDDKKNDDYKIKFERLRHMLILGLIAFFTSLLSHLDLWIAPFFFSVALTGFSHF